jgi:serine/threonine-protein kinase
MGVVFRATQLALGRPVALKLIAAAYATDVAFRERFKREWETAAAIDHPNVIPLYEAGEADHHLFIAMRWVEGRDLSYLLHCERQLAPDRAVRIISQVGAALDAAHARGLVHRDVKPANVLVAAEDHVYLTDFGLSKGPEASRMTKTGLFVGSVDYAAPEQVRGEATTARTDVYALGAMLYQVLTGAVPFDRPTDVAKMYAHITEPPPVVSALRRDAAAFDAIVLKAMAKEPAERFASAGALARAATAALAPPSSALNWTTVAGSHPAVPAPPPSASSRGVASHLGATRNSPEHRPLGDATHSAAVPAGSAPSWAAAPADGIPSRAEQATPAGAVTPTGGVSAPAAVAAPQPPAHEPAAAPERSDPAPQRLGSVWSAPPQGSGRRWPNLLLGAALPLVLVIGIVVAVFAAAGGEDEAEPPKPTVVPQATVAVQPARAAATIQVGEGPDGVAVSDGRVFVANQRGGTLSVVDPNTNEPAGEPIPAGTRPDGVVAGKGVVWVGAAGSDAVERFETQGEPVRTANVDVGNRPEALSLGKQLVWVANFNDGTVHRVDRATPSVVGGPIGVGRKPAGIFVGRFVWVTNSADDTVTRIDPSTAEVVGGAISVGDHPRGVIETAGAAWIANAGDDTVTRLDRKTGEPLGDPIRVGRDPRQLAFGFGSVWVTNNDDNSVTRIDAETGRVIGAPIPVGEKPLGIAAGAGAIWVANHESDTVTRIEP